jgi:hypothetical protein
MIKYSDLVAGLVGGTNGQVLFRDNNTFGGSNNLFWDNVNNRLGVGTTIPANTLDVNGTARVSGLIDSTNTFTSIGTFSTGIGLSKTTLNSSTSFSEVISVQGLARSLNNFAYRVYGVKGIGATDGSFGTQSIEILTGLQGAISVGNGNKTVTTAMSLFASAESIGTGNTITNYYGAYLQTPSGTTITNKWGLFQQDTTSKNYFGGNVLINTTTDAGFTLDVNGTARTGAATIQTLTIGLGAGAVITNTALGNRVLEANTTGASNTIVGYLSLLRNTTGSSNVALGSGVLNANITGSNNVGVGVNALRLATVNHNVGVGTEVLSATTTGPMNTAIGNYSLWLNTTGANNSALGYGTQSGNFSGSLILGHSATATANNQFVVGSAAINAGAVTSEVNTSTQVWNVVINGVARKILLA